MFETNRIADEIANEIRVFMVAHKVFFEILEKELAKADLKDDTKSLIRTCAVYGFTTNMKVTIEKIMRGLRDGSK